MWFLSILDKQMPERCFIGAGDDTDPNVSCQ